MEKDINNYGAKELLNFYCDHDFIKDTIPAMPVILGHFAYRKISKGVDFILNGYWSRPAFNNYAQPIFSRSEPYMVSVDEFDAYRASNATVFDSIETKIKAIAKKRLIGENAAATEAFDVLELDSVIISPAAKKLNASFIFPDGKPAFLLQVFDEENYDQIIAENQSLVQSILILAYTRVALTDGFLNDAVDIVAE
jgi:hypothetical protein